MVSQHCAERPQVYVDALGPTKGHEAFLSNLFPGINFTVEAKADSKYKIVSAASVAAKVTRDACLEGWVWEEAESLSEAAVWDSGVGSGYPAGWRLVPLVLTRSTDGGSPQIQRLKRGWEHRWTKRLGSQGW